jgi:hypothetical protein
LAQPPWQRTTDYPTNGYQFDPVEAGGRIYVAGGSNGASTSNVFYSAINTNASLGAWTPATPLPEADPGPGVAAYNGWIYVVLASGHVFRAAIQPSGALGNWIAEASVESATSYDTALKAYKDHLYLFGRYDGTYNNVIRIAAINGDGSLGAWGVGSLPLALNRQSVQFYSDRVYLAGGITTGNNVLGFSYSSPVRTNGALGAWRQEANVPVPLWYQASVIVNDQIFLLGGATNTTTTSQVNTVYQGAINATNGTIATWALTDSMPTDFNTGPGAVYVSANGNVYLVGGANTAASQFSNQVWQKLFAPSTNTAPVANPQTVTLSENTSATILLTGSDADGDPLTYIVTSLPTNGTLSGTAPNLLYQPNHNFSGGDGFTFKVNDGQTDSPPATVTLNVLPTTNHPPVAKIVIYPLAEFPGMSESVAIGGNGVNAMVVLDGSQSSDADGDPLQYQWFDGAQLISTSAVVTGTFSVGEHVISLVVSDGKDTGTETVTLEVITPAQAVELLIELVQDSFLPHNRKKPLLASLNAAEASFGRGHSTPAVNQLGAFQHKVHAQVAKIDSALAQELTDVSQEIIDAVTGRVRPLLPAAPGPGPGPPLPPGTPGP